MIKIRKEVCEVERIEAILCDRCGRQVRTEDEGWTDEYHEFLSIRHQCGWGLRLGDCLCRGRSLSGLLDRDAEAVREDHE